MKRHLAECALARKRINRARGTCGATHEQAGRLPHLEHKCPLELTYGGTHPGSHVCNVPRCEVTWY